MALASLRIFGVEIRLDASWIILALLMAWFLAGRVFPDLYSGQTVPSYWGMAAATVVAVAASIVLHELGHALTARAFGVRVSSITLFMFGGVAVKEAQRLPRGRWAATRLSEIAIPRRELATVSPLTNAAEALERNAAEERKALARHKRWASRRRPDARRSAGPDGPSGGAVPDGMIAMNFKPGRPRRHLRLRVTGARGAAILAAVLAFAAPRAANADAFQDAQTAYAQNRLSEARAGFQSVLDGDDAQPRARTNAARELARMAWLIDGNAAVADARLREAYHFGVDVCATAALEARILRESGRSRRAAERAQELAQRCRIASELDDLRLEEARAWLALAERTREFDRDGPLSSAKDSLSALSMARAAGADANRVDLEIALLAGDISAAHAAWSSYVFFEEAPADAQRSQLIFAAGLQSKGSDEERCTLMMMLIRAGLFEAALAFDAAQLTARNRASGACTLVQAYSRLRAALDAAVSAYNHAAARGEGDGSGLRRAVEGAFKNAAGAVAPRRRDTREVVREVWGLHYALGVSEGYMSLHAGHAVTDEWRMINQFDRTALVHFVSLDGMISNGYLSWLWDGATAAGGWTEGAATIVQVRSAYAHGGFRALDLTAGRAGRTIAEDRIAELERGDRAALAARPVLHLRGLASRLELQVVDAIARDARALPPAEPFETAFLRLYNRALIERSFFIHEGRHVLDRQHGGRLSPEELEFRAKLSELELARYPKSAFASINDELVGTGGPHGVANTRIIDIYRRWIEENVDQIPGFDPSQPGVSQLHLLTDEQIRAIARANDPEFAARRVAEEVSEDAARSVRL